MKFFNRRRKPRPPSVPAEEKEKQKVLDSKEVLKQARKYIEERNMKEAQKCCKKILRKEEDNYLALVMLGKSLEDSEAAPITFEKAVSLKPDNLLAWQGLAKYYEGKTDKAAQIKLCNIYEKILTLEITDDYAIKILKKQGELCCSLNNTEYIGFFLKYLKENHNPQVLRAAEKILLKLLHSFVPRNKEDALYIISVLEKKYRNRKGAQIILATVILQEYGLITCINKVMQLENFSDNCSLKEWVCELVCVAFVKIDRFEEQFEFGYFVDTLTSGIENRKYAALLIAIMCYRRGDIIKAYKKCAAIVNTSQKLDQCVATFLFQCAKRTNNPLLVEKIAAFLLKNKVINDPKLPINNPQFTWTLYDALLSSYYANGKCYEAISILRKIPIEKIDSMMLMNMGYLFLSSEINNDLIIKILDTSDYLNLFKALAYMKNRRFDEAISVFQVYDKHPIKYFFLAWSYSRVDRQDECRESLETALEYISDNPIIYFCLGEHYYKWQRNIDEGQMYFEISYNLNPCQSAVIKVLSEIYDRRERLDLEYNLLYNAVNMPQTKQFWVCARLGRICFIKGKIYFAIIYLKEAVRLNPKDTTAHEWLGDAYLYVKEYHEALKAYETVVELSTDIPVLLYSYNQIGTIYMIEKKYNKAAFIFDGILMVDPVDIQALKSITEIRVITARKMASQNLFYSARDEIQRAINQITRAIIKDAKDNIVWHLLGDTLIFLSRLPEHYCYVKLQTSQGEIQKNGKVVVYDLAIKSYSHLIKFKDPIALFKCAHSYLEYYHITKSQSILQISYNLAVLCITVNPISWRNWDLLGKICYFAEKYALSHKSFYAAITSNSNQSVTKVWCNLGILYQKLEKDRLAKYCFTISNFASPTYPTEWIGNGLLAEMMAAEGNFAIFSPDTNSTFFFTENDFTDWITTISELRVPAEQLQFEAPIQMFKNIQDGIDILEWYLTTQQPSPSTCTLLGQIQEEKGVLNSAYLQYENAYEMTQDEDLKRKLRVYKARVLLKLKHFVAGICVFGDSEELEVESAWNLGHALMEEKSYNEAYIAFNMIVSHLDDRLSYQERLNTLVIMANIANIIKDSSFAATVLDRAAEVFLQDRESAIQFFKSYLITKVTFEVAVTFMSERQSSHMSDDIWWYYRGLNYLRGPKTYASEASSCIQRAIGLTSENDHVDELGKMHAMVAISEFYAGNRDNGKYYAYQALAVYPFQSELWAALILCVFSHREWPGRDAWIFKTIYALRQQISITPPIRQWLRDLEDKLVRND